jgi:3-oxoacyl-[acyl-carrier protein] reductase
MRQPSNAAVSGTVAKHAGVLLGSSDTGEGAMQGTSKTILVTGATGGIGLAVCDRLAKGGATLLLAARDAGKLQTLCERLPVIGPDRHAWITVDMTSDDSVQQFAEQLTAQSVILDGAVLMPPQDPPTSDPLPSSEKWREILQNSFVGPLALLKAAIGTMRPDPAHGKRCKIVVISGISSAQVLGDYASSNVIRCAWLAEAKTLAFALGDQGIHVNTLSLGGTLTPGYTASLEKRAANAGMSFEQRRAEETSNVPLRKYGTPQEVAGAVEGLLSAFSDHMTGHNVLHDGGFTRAY